MATFTVYDGSGRKLYARGKHQVNALDSFAEAQALADAAMKQHPGRVFLPYDYGESVWPRYGIMEPPAVGDDVSMGFNGDYYYVGKVEKIGKNYRQIKAGGKWFYRRKLRPAWREAKSPFALVNGIRNELNPSF